MKKHLSWTLLLVPLWIVIQLNAHPFNFINIALNELYFDGLRHASKSRAILEIQEDKLVLQNTGVSCEDGVDIFLGETRGFGFELIPLDPETDPLGAQKEWIMYGEIDGMPDIKSWSEVHTLIGLGESPETVVAFDASPLGATKNFVKAYSEDGVLLYNNEFPTGEIYRYYNCCPPEPYVARWDATCVVLPPIPTKITFPDGTSFTGKIARIESGPADAKLMPKACNRVESWVKDAEKNVLCNERIAMFEERYYNRALGSTQYNASEQGHQLQLNNLQEQEGISGVEVDVNMAEEFCMVFAPYELNPNGQSALDFSAEAYGPNGGIIPFGKLSFEELENGNGFLVAPDFSELPNFNPDQIIYDGITEGGEVVFNIGRGRAPLTCSSPIKVAGKLTGIGRDNPLPCFYLEWEDGNFIDFQGQTLRVNKLFVRAESEVPVENMATFSVTTRNISSLTIIDEKSEIDVCCRRKDCPNEVLRFDGLGDYLQISSNPLSGAQDFTIESWVYPQDSDGLSGCGGNFERIFGFGGNRFEIGVCGGQLSVVASSAVGLQITPMPNDQWHHVAATRSGNTLNVYLNCELVYSETTNLNLGGAFRVGSWAGAIAVNETWEGKMDEFRIWDYAKSIEEIEALKNCPLPSQQEGLLVYYNFDNSINPLNPSLSILPDLSGNGFDGTFIGFDLTASPSIFECETFVECTSCKADFSWSQIDECGTIEFTNLSTGTGLTYSWDFTNDGIFDTHKTNPTFLYPIPGTYTVCLTIENDTCEDRICKEVLVEGEEVAPVAVCVDELTIPVMDACEVAIGPDLIDAGSFDNCRINSIKVSREFISSEEICQPIPIQLTVKDWAGNESTCTSIVTLLDNEAPIMTCPPDIKVEAELGTGVSVTGIPVVTDNCDFFIEFVDEELGGETCPGSVLRTWRAVDRCGNEATCDQQVFINCDVCTPCADTTPVNNNLIENGDFENGNTDFSSDYDYVATASLDRGDYSVRNSVNLGNVQWSNKDHTANLLDGLFLVCDGADDTNLVCYRTEVKVEEGVSYTFCAFVNNVVRPQSDFGNPVLEVLIDGTPVLSGIELEELPDGWDLLTADYTADGTKSIAIEIRSTVSGLGIDYAIDDVSFYKCESMHTSARALDYLGTIKLMPNPATEKVTIHLESPSSKAINAQLKTIEGKLIKQKRMKAFANQLSFDVYQLPQGIYILNLIDEDGALWSKKVIKQ